MGGTGGIVVPKKSCGERVILLHGLCRTTKSMAVMERALRAEGYEVRNVGYLSRTAEVSELVDAFLVPEIEKLQAEGGGKIHFVTHSLGGILVRDYLGRYELPELGRVVMLSPPNQGSEVVDKIGHWKLFRALNGPAGDLLGTEEGGYLKSLPAVDFELGVITGSGSINWINSCMIEGQDDGKVSVANAKVKGMKDFAVVRVTHPMIMKRGHVIEKVGRFLKLGEFNEE